MIEASFETSIGTDELFPLVYDELKRIARFHLRRERGRATICTTELVHETFMRLTAGHAVTWQTRAHFFGSASRAMRQVLVAFAKRRTAAKRRGEHANVSLADAERALEVELEQIVAVDEALRQLDTVNQRLRQVVELRFFGGISEEEIAKILGVSSRTVERDWLKARLFLLHALGSGEASPV